MNSMKIYPIPALTPTKSSLSGYSSNGGNKGDNQDNNSGQTFQDIFKQMLEKQSPGYKCQAYRLLGY